MVVAPNRRRRPGAKLPHQTSGGSGLDHARSLEGRAPGAEAGLIEEPGQAELDECPFCEGREDRTPPETFRVGAESSWAVRVVPNLYPAFERQEVVVHSPRHVRTFAELMDAEVAGVAQAWAARFDAARSEGFPYVHALINEGADAGSSLAHSHSQLVWLREPPPEVAREHGSPPVAAAELLVAERGHMTAAVHSAGRLPYETLIAGDPFDLGAALLLLRDVVARLRAVEGAAPWNAWLHVDHVEVVPRLSVLAGVELGAGIYVNTVAPEDAAAALRGVF